MRTQIIASFIVAAIILTSCHCEKSLENYTFADSSFQKMMPYSGIDTLYFLHNNNHSDTFLGQGMVKIDDDVRPAILERLHRPKRGDRSDRAGRGGLGGRTGWQHHEPVVAFDHVGEQAPIAGLEDVQRQRGAGEQHHRQREQGQPSHAVRYEGKRPTCMGRPPVVSVA